MPMVLTRSPTAGVDALGQPVGGRSPGAAPAKAWAFSSISRWVAKPILALAV